MDLSIFIFAANDWSALKSVFTWVLDLLITIAPLIIVLSFAFAALLWTIAGHSRKLVELAKRQAQATVIATGILAGFFVIKGVIMTFAAGGF